MTFEDFIQKFGEWYGSEKRSACLVGIRAGESLNRFRTLVNTGKRVWGGKQWTTHIGNECFNVYPLYDWKTEDVWTYFGRTGKPYTRIYDRMHQAGLKLSQMRICEPYGDEQRKGLWLFHVLEPATWNRISCRVAGANSGALYANEVGNVLGNRSISLPAGYTWKSFAEFLLQTLPPKTSEHYRNKIAVYLKWCQAHNELVPDEQLGDTGSKDVPSWRRICKCLLKNDFWCRTLSFNPTKNSAYERYLDLMKRRRKEWGIFNTEDQA
jgi:predicted phosphoadenosine phosphosulfate sulfurtransferase